MSSFLFGFLVVINGRRCSVFCRFLRSVEIDISNYRTFTFCHFCRSCRSKNISKKVGSICPISRVDDGASLPTCLRSVEGGRSNLQEIFRTFTNYSSVLSMADEKDHTTGRTLFIDSGRCGVSGVQLRPFSDSGSEAPDTQTRPQQESFRGDGPRSLDVRSRLLP